MKQLRFIHISKTGGHAISEAAKKHANLNWGMKDTGYGEGIMCHNLLSCVNTPELNSDEEKNKYDWFAVVRNPYHRILSKYNMFRRRQDCNTYIKNILDSIPSFDNFVPYFIEPGVISIEQHHWPHIMPQYKYIEPQYNIIVLRYENLNDEFTKLMKQYGYDFTIENKENVARNSASLSDLSLDTIEYINRYYEKDFIKFGYEMRHETFTTNH